MRHQVAGRHLNRPTGHRMALYRNLVKDLLRHGRIQTTLAKAKESKGLVDKIITYGKKGTLHHRRLALAAIPNSRAVGKVFDVLGPRYNERAGGYTRVIRVGSRKGDAAPLAQLELV